MRWMRAFWLVFNRSGFCHMDRFGRNSHKPLCNWKCEKETRKYSHTLLKKKNYETSHQTNDYNHGRRKKCIIQNIIFIMIWKPLKQGEAKARKVFTTLPCLKKCIIWLQYLSGRMTRFTHAIAANEWTDSHNFKTCIWICLQFDFRWHLKLDRGNSLLNNRRWKRIILSVGKIKKKKSSL